MYHRRILLLSTFLIFCIAAGAQTPFNRLYVFGDSYSDIGEGYLDGNGPTAVAYLAQDLGFVLLPADKSTNPNQSLDFAISGAQTGSGQGKHMETALLGFGMLNQVADFEQRLNHRQIQFNASKTLFFIAGGLNDHSLPAETTVQNLQAEVRTLYKLGARHFEIALLPTAIPAFAEVGLRLNPVISLIPAQLRSELPSAQISLSKWGPFFDEVMHSPQQYGIIDTKEACAGREIFHQDSKPCANPDAHFYYHAGHPSTAVHKIVGQKLADEILNSPLK